MTYQVVSPILGFEDIKEFSLERVDDFFSHLKSEEITFTLINPVMLRHYEIEIPHFYKNLLEIEEGDRITLYAIVTLYNPIQESTINFLAPVIVNEDKKLLAQVALDGAKYKDFGIAESIKGYL